MNLTKGSLKLVRSGFSAYDSAKDKRLNQPGFSACA